MSRGAANTLWARSFVDELARSGVSEVVLAPGARSTPLVMAFARDARFRVRVHLDERSAAFFALGVGKASGAPAVVLTTSGTATANALPAVVEAFGSETPLLVLTADRPARLRGADANQTIDQVGLYGAHVRASFEAPHPVLEGPELRYLRALACRAVAASQGPPAGPVHVNLPFDKPLEPVEPPEDFLRTQPLASGGRPGGEPFVRVAAGRRSAAPATLEELTRVLASAEGVIVAGPSPEPERLGPLVLKLAAATGFPVLADALSGARYGPAGGAHVVAAYDLFLREKVAVERLRPSVVLRVGASPTSAPLLEWLVHHNGVEHVVVDGGGRWKDHTSTVTRYVEADAADTLAALASRLPRAASDDWAALWRSAERAALDAISAPGKELHEGDIWKVVRDVLPPDGTVFVSSSMPVRDLDAFGR
ncbi:MAG: 2-succinyl-5-enolpyruvyl-6-hydroxy-3-cyclohexene-1-carboxylic-acid synthase, partial [Gemmatimonadota bacterium]